MSEWNWMMGESSHDEIIQSTDSYVVHARGFTVGADIWFDEYSVHKSHNHLWNEYIRHRYDGDEYIGDWDTEKVNVDKPVLYWSITGAASFIVQHPSTYKFDDKSLEQLQLTLEAMGCDGGVSVRVNKPDIEETSSGHTKNILQKIKESGKMDENYKCEEILAANGVDDL